MHSVMTSSSSKPRSRTRFDRRREATREQIIQAAPQVMAERGLHATKIADIAAAADVGVGTFYLHFETKQELFDELVVDAISRLTALIDDVRSRSQDVVTQVRATTRAVCQFAADNREVFRLVFGQGDVYSDVVREAQTRFADDFERTIRDGIAAGDVSTLDPPLAARALVGMVTQMLAWWTADDTTPIEQIETTLTTLTVRGLLPTDA